MDSLFGRQCTQWITFQAKLLYSNFVQISEFRNDSKSYSMNLRQIPNCELRKKSSQCPLSNCTVRAGLGNLSHFKQSNHTEISRLLNFGVKTPSWSNFRNNSKKYSMNFGNLRQICNCVHPRKLIQNESTSSQFPLQNCTDRTSKMTRFHQGTQQKKWREPSNKKLKKTLHHQNIIFFERPLCRKLYRKFIVLRARRI